MRNDKVPQIQSPRFSEQKTTIQLVNNTYVLVVYDTMHVGRIVIAIADF